MDWKQKHAIDAEAAWKHEITQNVINEQIGNITRNSDLDAGLVEYSLTKIAMYAAQVARAQALGFDPNLLKLSEDEANTELLNFAKRLVHNGKHSVVIFT